MPYTQEKLLRMLADVIASKFPISDVELLVQAGADPNGCVTHGLRPMHYAAFAGGEASYVETLVQLGADVNCVDDVGYTPLHLAAKAGHVTVLRTLIEHGACFERKEGARGRTLSQPAESEREEISERVGRQWAESQRVQAGRAVFQSEANESVGRSSETDAAAHAGSERVNNELPDDDRRQNEADGQTSGEGRNVYNDWEQEDTTASGISGASAVRENTNIVDTSVQVGLQEVVEALAPIEAGQGDNAPGSNAAETLDVPSSAADDEGENKALLADSPLGLAVENEQIACMEVLLQNGADPNIKSFLGNLINTTPFDNIECLRLLLRYGANPDALSRGGMTALMRAAKQNQVEAVKMLIDYGADVNVQCPPRFDRRRAIHFATMVGSVDIVNVLLAAGAFTNKPPGYNCAPLEYAITHDKLEICCVLLRHGADPDELNDEGCAPLQVVCATPSLKHQREMIECLLRAGAHVNLHSERFSYTGPSLCPIVEYLTYCEEPDFTVVKTFLQFGARVNFAVPTRLLKIHDASGLLGQLRKLRPYDDLLDLLTDAAGRFELDAIGRDNALSNAQRAALLEAAGTTRSLKQLARLRIVQQLTTMMRAEPNNCYEQLPIPGYLRKYLMFDTF